MKTFDILALAFGAICASGLGLNDKVEDEVLKVNFSAKNVTDAKVPGVQLDADFEDGLFEAEFGTGRLSNVKLLARHNPSETEAGAISNLKMRSRITGVNKRLEMTQTNCNDFDLVDAADYVQSKFLLDKYCKDKPWVLSKKVIGYKIGGVMAYMCNYGKPIQCLANELDDDMNWLNSHCNGQQETGFVWHNDVKKVYGRDLLTNTICGNM